MNTQRIATENNGSNVILFPFNQITPNLDTLETSCSAPKEISSDLKVSPPILDDEYLSGQSNPHKPHMLIQPIYKIEDIIRIKNYFLNTPSRFKNTNTRNYMYFVLGLNIARRTGDILQLKIQDFINPDGTFKTHLIINKEQKTKKRSIPIPIHNSTKKAIALYLSTLPSYSMSDYLFTNYKTGKPISVEGMRVMMKRMAKALNLSENVATHTPRKTAAYQMAKEDPSNELKISRLLGHSNVETTHIYMQASQEDIDDMVLNSEYLNAL